MYISVHCLFLRSMDQVPEIIRFDSIWITNATEQNEQESEDNDITDNCPSTAKHKGVERGLGCGQNHRGSGDEVPQKLKNFKNYLQANFTHFW